MKNKPIQSNSVQTIPIRKILQGKSYQQSQQVQSLVIDEQPINNCIIVGLLMEILISNDGLLFQAVIDDTTGRIRIVHHLHDPTILPFWLEEIKKINPKRTIYVKAVIKPKMLMKDMNFRCEFLEIVKDANQIITHILDCIASQKFRKSQIPSQNEEIQMSQNLQTLSQLIEELE